MFRRREDIPEEQTDIPAQVERITSVLGDGTSYHGKLTGRGGVRIEGAFDGEIMLNGLLVVGTTGKITCEDLRARTVIVAGSVFFSKWFLGYRDEAVADGQFYQNLINEVDADTELGMEDTRQLTEVRVEAPMPNSGNF